MGGSSTTSYALYNTSSDGLGLDMSASEKPVRVVVAGGSYAGFTAVLTLIDLIKGLQPRIGVEAPFDPELCKPHKVEIVLLDERDGFC